MLRGNPFPEMEQWNGFLQTGSPKTHPSLVLYAPFLLANPCRLASAPDRNRNNMHGLLKNGGISQSVAHTLRCFLPLRMGGLAHCRGRLRVCPGTLATSHQDLGVLWVKNAPFLVTQENLKAVHLAADAEAMLSPPISIRPPSLAALRPALAASGILLASLGMQRSECNRSNRLGVVLGRRWVPTSYLRHVAFGLLFGEVLSLRQAEIDCHILVGLESVKSNLAA